MKYVHLFPLMILLGIFGTYFAVLLPNILYEKDGALWAGHVNVWGDWALHIGMVNHFATQSPQEWFLHHPVHIQSKFTYSFLTNLISAFFVKIGVPLTVSMLLPSYFYVLFLVSGLYFLAYRITQSTKTAVLSVFLFLFSGGPLIFYNIYQWFSGIPVDVNLQANGFGRVEQYEWLSGSVVNALIIPQRAYLLGFTIAIWSLVLFLQSISLKGKNDKMFAIVGGVFAGLLPIAHMHSFIALAIVGFCVFIYALLQRKILTPVLLYGFTASCLGVPLYLMFISGGIDDAHFFRFDLWWTANHFFEWVVLWSHIWGAMIPLGIYGIVLAWKEKKKQVGGFVFLIGFGIIWVLANIFQFQPFAWDNSKLFYWGYLALSIGSASFMISLFESANKKILNTLFAIFLFILFSLAGMANMGLMLRKQYNSFELSSVSDLKLASWIRSNTDKKSIFVIDFSTHNSPAFMMTGRPIVLGYTGWLWTYGINYHQTEQDVRKIYSGAPEAVELMQKYNVSYVVISYGAIQNLQADQAFFSTRYLEVFRNASGIIYDVSSIHSVR